MLRNKGAHIHIKTILSHGDHTSILCIYKSLGPADGSISLVAFLLNDLWPSLNKCLIKHTKRELDAVKLMQLNCKILLLRRNILEVIICSFTIDLTSLGGSERLYR